MSGPILPPTEGVPQSSLTGQRVLERFEVCEELGRGGSGVVYRGKDLVSGMPVAVKVLLSAIDTPATRTRFLREANVQLGLNHPHLARGIAAGNTAAGEPVLVTEYVEGATVYDAIYELRRMTPRRAMVIARQVLLGLEHAHGTGVIHRDLKPENVLLIEQGRPGQRFVHVKVIDFGLVATVSSPAGGFQFTRITVSGFSMGTPAYMAPEQALGAELDARTDLYALGTMIFEMIAGQLPFDDEDPARLLQRRLAESPPQLADIVPGPWCTPEVEALLAGALAPEPSARLPGARAMLEAVERAFSSLDVLPEDPPW